MPRDWREPADYADLRDLDLSGLAWEFLRRSPAYVRAFEGAPGGAGDDPGRHPTWRFGLRFPLDPRTEARQAALFWRAEVAPAHVVPLAPAPSGGPAVAELERRATAARSAADGRHLRLAGGLQVVAPDTEAGAGLGALVALDGHYRIRLAAAGALARLLHARPPAPDPLSTLSRNRVVLMLRALDSQAQAASYRDVAAGLLGARPEGSQAWRVSNARDVAIRLCRAARRLAGGGYARFLALRR